MKLTNAIIANTISQEKPFKLSDGGGMYLHVMPNGSKYWRCKYRFQGKEKTIALGVYPDVSLKDARNRREDARRQLAQNIDPNAVKKELKEEMTHKFENTFGNIALEWYEKNFYAWDEEYRKRILKRLESDVIPILGTKPIQDISAPELLKTLRIVEQRTVGTAHRLLQICSQIYRYAIATGKVDIDITMSLRGALQSKKQSNYASLAEKDLPKFLKDLDNYLCIQTKLALKLLILTFVRSTELRGARWEEIDWDKSEWRIPGERMKMNAVHIVPLSCQAVKILRELQLISGNREYIFPGKNPDTCISENILLHAIYDLGYKGKTTVHGFRATASTILNENGFPVDVIERQLAHTDNNKVRASYNHAQHLPERRKMMQWWSDFIDQQNGSNVIQIKRA